MHTKIQKWGNSLGVRIPKTIALEKNLQEGTGVSMMIINNQIVIEPIVEEVSLASLLSNVHESNVHSETVWSEPVGNEIW